MNRCHVIEESTLYDSTCFLVWCHVTEKKHIFGVKGGDYVDLTKSGEIVHGEDLCRLCLGTNFKLLERK